MQRGASSYRYPWGRGLGSGSRGWWGWFSCGNEGKGEGGGDRVGTDEGTGKSMRTRLSKLRKSPRHIAAKFRRFSGWGVRNQELSLQLILKLFSPADLALASKTCSKTHTLKTVNESMGDAQSMAKAKFDPSKPMSAPARAPTSTQEGARKG